MINKTAWIVSIPIPKIKMMCCFKCTHYNALRCCLTNNISKDIFLRDTCCIFIVSKHKSHCMLYCFTLLVTYKILAYNIYLNISMKCTIPN